MKNPLRLAAILSLLTAQSYADASDECTHAKTTDDRKMYTSSDLYLSHPEHKFELQVSTLILQPSSSNLHYGAEANPFPTYSPNWKIHEIVPSYHVGFDIGLVSHLHSTNSSVMLNWEYFHSTDSASKNLPVTNMIGPFFEIGPDASTYKQGYGKVTFHFNQVSLDYGLMVNIGDRLKTNLYSGVSFASIKQTLYSQYQDVSGSTFRSITTPSTFQGVGPQLGLDFCYKIVKGFHLTGKAAGSLFVGPQRNNTTYVARSPGLTILNEPSPNTQSTHVHKKVQVVPGIEGNLGLSYVFNLPKHYKISLEAGYQAQVFIDAIQSVDMGSEVITPPVTPDTVGVFARTFEQNLSNFALAGPYVKIDIGF